jgi:hypothetical protein
MEKLPPEKAAIAPSSMLCARLTFQAPFGMCIDPSRVPAPTGDPLRIPLP